MAIIEGTSSQTANISWRVSNNTCFDGSGTEYTINIRSVTIGPNLPFSIDSLTWNLNTSGVPAGSYHVCAMIDYDEAITESSEADNTLWSEGSITVVN